MSYLWSGWNFTVGASNLTNQYPDKAVFANTAGGNLPYPESAPYGFSGAYYYASVTYHW